MGTLAFTLSKKASTGLSRIVTLTDLGFKWIILAAVLKIDSNSSGRKQGKQLGEY